MDAASSAVFNTLEWFSIHNIQSPRNWPRILAALLALAVLTRWVAHKSRNYPPGPRGWPLIGNLLELGGDAWLTFTKWKTEYGPLTYLSVAGQPVLIINSHKVAADLLDRRASLYSDRPRNIVASEILTRGLLVVFTRYSDLWRRMRRAAHEGLNKGVAPTFYALQTTEAVLLTHGLLTEPDSWDLHLRRTAASTVITMIYDLPTLKSAYDPTIRKINDFVQRLTRAAYPGSHFVEFFTWMKYLPSSIAKWKRDAEEWFLKDAVMFEGLYGDVEKRVNNGDERPSFSATLVNQKDRHGLNKTQSAYLAGTMYAAGAETTSAVLAWFMHAMLLYPEVQKKAQEELDAVVGRSRMPTFADLDGLPYIRALVRESLRFRPVDPVGLPHRLIQDDYYEGYFIPKGTIVIANVWGLNRDPETHGADAEEFNPARHLDKDGQLAPAPVDTKEEGHVTYGFGRRICVGRHIANNSLFIDIASVLWALKIAPTRDANGKPILPLVHESVNDGLVVRPVPFKVSITPRFPEAGAILTQAVELQGH